MCCHCGTALLEDVAFRTLAGGWVPDNQQMKLSLMSPPPHTHTHTHTTHTLLDKVVVSLVSSPALQMAQAVMLPSFQQRYQAITVIVRGGEGGREGGLHFQI